mgnify:CR=1 FL=1
MQITSPICSSNKNRWTSSNEDLLPKNFHYKSSNWKKKHSHLTLCARWLTKLSKDKSLKRWRINEPLNQSLLLISPQRCQWAKLTILRRPELPRWANKSIYWTWRKITSKIERSTPTPSLKNPRTQPMKKNLSTTASRRTIWTIGRHRSLINNSWTEILSRPQNQHPSRTNYSLRQVSCLWAKSKKFMTRGRKCLAQPMKK